MYIDDDTLRKQLNRILLVKTRNQIVQEIKSKGLKMHQFQLNNFLQGKDVTLSTLHKIDRLRFTRDLLKQFRATLTGGFFNLFA
jgi:hypothetical protein